MAHQKFLKISHGPSIYDPHSNPLPLFYIVSVASLRYFNFETDFFKNKNLLQKTAIQFSNTVLAIQLSNTVFWFKVLELKTHYFHTKLPSQKPKFRQIQWWVQDQPITKNGVLPVTNLFFQKFCFSFQTSSWFNVLTTLIYIFIFFESVEVSFEGAFSLWVSLMKLRWVISELSVSRKSL